MEQTYQEDFKKKKDKIKTYRILTIQTLAHLACIPNFGSVVSPIKRPKNSLELYDGDFNAIELVNVMKDEKLTGELTETFSAAQYAN